VNIWRLDTPAPGGPASSSQVVSFSSTRSDFNPAFSPEGRRVAFGSSRSGKSEVWLADLDASNAVQLTSMSAPRTGTPGWSPDGQTIAFDSNLEGQYEIYTIPASGGKPRRLTSHPANDHVPSFSRDGKWIYFSSNRSGDFQIWKVPSSGGDAVQVTHNGGFVAFESTDGLHVYYTQTANTPSILWRISTRGGEPVKVLEGVIQRAFTMLETGVYYIEATEHKAALPMLSIPGAAFGTGNAGRLRFFDFAAGTSRVVADLGAGIGQGLTASPDGRTVLFSRIDSSTNDLMMVENFR
jgi:dipeptidyl aminopeptidase/acylaminoacyl peptidase